MRYKYQSVARDGNGVVISSGTVSVYLAGTTTPASIYTSSTSTDIVNSVTTSSNGVFTFYVDAFDYGSFQRFKYTFSHPNWSNTFTEDNISVNEVITGNYTISTAKTFTYPVEIPYGVTFTQSATGSIAINSSFSAGDYQIFIDFGAGEVTGLKEVNPKWFGTLNTAITVISSNAASVKLNYAETLTANLTIPSTCELNIVKGGSIVKASTYTLTINGPLSAGLYQVFSGFSAGDVTFGVDSITESHPEWFAANTTPGTTDMTTAAQSAIDAFHKVMFSKNTYLVGKLTLNSNNMILGANRYASILKAKVAVAESDVLYATGKTNLTVKNLTINGNSANQTQNVLGINFQDCSDVYVEDNEILNNSGSYEVRIQSISSNISNIKVKGNNIYRSVTDTGDGSLLAIFGTDAAPLKTASGVLIEDNHLHCDSTSALKDGTELVGTSGLTIVNNRVHGMGGYGISVDVENIGAIKITDNSAYSNGFSGIGLMGATSTVFPTSTLVSGNSCYSNTENGILVSSIPRAIVEGNTCSGNGYRGVSVETALAVDTVVRGNICINNGSGLTTTNAAGIYIGSFADKTVIEGNVCTNTAGTAQKYGIRLEAASTNTVVGRNSLTGNGTGELSIAGTLVSEQIVNNFIIGRHAESSFLALSTGDDITAADTIAPNGQIVQVAGATTINTITAPYAGFDGPLILIPGAGVNTGMGGNIAIATTAVAGKAIIMTYSHWTSKWYPSY